MRQLTGAAVAVAVACALTAVVLAAGCSASPATKTTPARGAAGSPPVSAAPYYVVIDSRVGTAAVRRTATGAKIATVRRPRGGTFFGVAAGQDDKTFVLAALISSTTHFYRLRRTLAKFHPGDGYPMWLSWTSKGSLAYEWTSTRMGVFIIANATRPGASARLLVSSSASVGGYTDANFPLITPDGSSVFVTVAHGSLALAIAEFSVRGAARRLLTPSVRNPAQFCGPLWTDASGRRILAQALAVAGLRHAERPAHRLVRHGRDHAHRRESLAKQLLITRWAGRSRNVSRSDSNRRG